MEKEQNPAYRPSDCYNLSQGMRIQKKTLCLWGKIICIGLLPLPVTAGWLDSAKRAISNMASGAADAAATVGQGALAGAVAGAGAGVQMAIGNDMSVHLAQCRQLASVPGGMYSPQYQMNCQQQAPSLCMQQMSMSQTPEMDPYCATVLGYGVSMQGPWGASIPAPPSMGPVAPGTQAASNVNSQNLGWSVPVPPNYFAPMPMNGMIPGLNTNMGYANNSLSARSMGQNLVYGTLSGLMGVNNAQNYGMGYGSTMYGYPPPSIGQTGNYVTNAIGNSIGSSMRDGLF